MGKDRKEAKKDSYREDRYKRCLEGEIIEKDNREKGTEREREIQRQRQREGQTERGNRRENRGKWKKENRGKR